MRKFMQNYFFELCIKIDYFCLEILTKKKSQKQFNELK
jgi:hypothetical protein